jgi:methionyl-tRNA formyltransferase
VVKTWAIENRIPAIDPPKLDNAAADLLKKERAEVFIVASYGKIIPNSIILIPTKKVLNIHPSLLPKYRGPSPLPTAILDDEKKTGITIMRIDEQMDHGPVIAQKEVAISEWPTYEQFEEMMAREGAKILAEILPAWVAEQIDEKEQDHSKATYTKKFTKEDGLIDLSSADQYSNFRKIQAFHEWPQAYFFVDHAGKQIRVKVTEAEFKDGKLEIKKVIPEGKKEMTYEEFRQGYGNLEQGDRR